MDITMSSKHDKIYAKAMEEAKMEAEMEVNQQDRGNPTCKYCGKEIKLNGLFMHEKHCPDNPINIAKRELGQRQKREQVIKEQRQSSLKDIEEMENKIDSKKTYLDGSINNPRIAIPLSHCSRDIGYVKENKPFFMKVMGRKVGDKVYVEEVSLMRL